MSPTVPHTPISVLARSASYLAPELLGKPSCFPTEQSDSIKPFAPSLDQWKLVVSQDAPGVGPYTCHRHQTSFVLRCTFRGLALESLYKLLTETHRSVAVSSFSLVLNEGRRRKDWDKKAEASRVVERLQSPYDAIVEYYKLSGTFRTLSNLLNGLQLTSHLSGVAIIKQRELVLLSTAATLPRSSDERVQIIGGSASVEHPDVPHSKSHPRFVSFSSFLFSATPEGAELVQVRPPPHPKYFL